MSSPIKSSDQNVIHRQRDSISGDASTLGSHSSHQYQHLHHYNLNAQSASGSHHPILRVASAHGSRDCVHLLPLSTVISAHIQQQQSQHQMQVNQQQQAQMHQQQKQMQMKSQLSVTPSPQQSTPGPSPAPTVSSPPLYQQAIHDIAAKFSTYRKSPETSRAVQAVQPFGLKNSGDQQAPPLILPTVIPKECQVVKQLVRDAVATQLAAAAAAGSGHQQFATNQQATSVGVAPPPYNRQGHNNVLRKQTSADGPQRNSDIHSPVRQTALQSPAQLPTPIDNNVNSALNRTTNQRPCDLNDQSPTGAGSLRLSLSHSDLTRLQTLSLAPPTHADQSVGGVSRRAPSSALQQQQQMTKMHPLLAAQQSGLALASPSAQALEHRHYEQNSSSFMPHSEDLTASLLQRPSCSSSSRQLESLLDSPAYLQYLNLQRQQRHLLESHQSPLPSVQQNLAALDALEHASRGTNNIIAVLADENKKLRADLEVSFKKALKLQQLELQYQKMSRDYEELVRRQEKREQLEMQMHKKMQIEMAKLGEMNNGLNDQLEVCYSQIDQCQAENVELRQELTRISSQNKELFAIKERQEIEMEAQRATLEEQRAHIVILDKALSNAQEKVSRLDEECKKRASMSQRCEQLQQEVNTLRDAVQKRDDLYKRNVAQLQKELTQVKLQKKENKKSSSGELEDVSVSKLKRELQEKENQIFNFQQESEQWQKLYNDEVDRRSLAVNELSDAKNTRIKVLEEVSSKSEKRIEELENKLKVAEARYNILKRQSQPATNSAMVSSVHESAFSEGRNAKSNLFGTVPDLLDGSKKRLEAVHRMLQNPASPSPYRCYSSVAAGGSPPGLYKRRQIGGVSGGGKFLSLDCSFTAASSKVGGGGNDDVNDEFASLGSRHYGGGGGNAAALDDCSWSTAIGAGRRAVGGGASSVLSRVAAASRGGGSYDARSSYGAPTPNMTSSTQRFSATSSYMPRELFTLPTRRRSRAEMPKIDRRKSNRPRSADDHFFSRSDDDLYDSYENSLNVGDGVAESNRRRRDDKIDGGRGENTGDGDDAKKNAAGDDVRDAADRIDLLTATGTIRKRSAAPFIMQTGGAATTASDAAGGGLNRQRKAEKASLAPNRFNGEAKVNDSDEELFNV